MPRRNGDAIHIIELSCRVECLTVATAAAADTASDTNDLILTSGVALGAAARVCGSSTAAAAVAAKGRVSSLRAGKPLPLDSGVVAACFAT